MHVDSRSVLKAGLLMLGLKRDGNVQEARKIVNCHLHSLKSSSSTTNTIEVS